LEQKHSFSIAHRSCINTTKVFSPILVQEEQEEEEYRYADDSFEEEKEQTTLTNFQVHDRIQVFWKEENTWFDGKIIRLEDKTNGIFVLYDDGDEAYEKPQDIRLAPPLPAENTPKRHVQLQSDKLRTSNLELCMDHQVLVYWTEEKQWFSGRITQCNQEKQQLQVTYDDGDVNWESHFHQMIMVIEEKPLKTSVSSLSTDSVFKERVLVPRKYTCVLKETSHFQPEIIARPYQAVVNDHTSCIKIPRQVYHERTSLQIKKSLSMDSITTLASDDSRRKENMTQTCINNPYLYYCN
jgi:hypothetical protein